LAYRLGVAFTEAALAQGRQPVWECDATNKASHALALKLGYGEFHRYTCFGVPL